MKQARLRLHRKVRRLIDEMADLAEEAESVSIEASITITQAMRSLAEDWDIADLADEEW